MAYLKNNKVERVIIVILLYCYAKAMTWCSMYILGTIGPKFDLFSGSGVPFPLSVRSSLIYYHLDFFLVLTPLYTNGIGLDRCGQVTSYLLISLYPWIRYKPPVKIPLWLWPSIESTYGQRRLFAEACLLRRRLLNS